MNNLNKGNLIMKKLRCLMLLCAAVLCLMLSVSCSGNKEVPNDGAINGLLVKFNEKRDAASVVGIDGTVKDIVVPKTVSGMPITGIAEYAFSGHDEITSVTLTDNIQSIGTCAFKDCTGLKSITIPASVIRLEHSVFSGCTGLESVEILRTNETITKGKDCTFGEFVFKDCTSLKTVTMGSGIKKLSSRMFYNCKALENVTLSDTLTAVDKYAFAYCTSLKEITVPESLTTMGENVFKGCDAMEKVSVPFVGANKFGTGSVKLEYLFGEGSAISSIPKSLNSVTVTGKVKIGDGALEGCSEIKEIVLSDNVTGVGSNAFSGTAFYNNNENWKDGALYIGNHLIEVNNASGDYEVKEGTVSIAGGAFRGCEGLTGLTMPESVKSIGASAFADCKGLKTVTVPDSVTAIGDSAFSGCTGLTEIKIGSGVKNMDNNVFGGCSALTTITCKIASQPKSWNETWLGDCSAKVEWKAEENK